MFDKQTQAEILESLEQVAKDAARKYIVLGSAANLNDITSRSSGRLAIKPSILKQDKFSLILSKPSALEAFDWHEIHCCLCDRIVSYPIWHYEIKYSINRLHYFICFDSASPTKPSINCYRR